MIRLSNLQQEFEKLQEQDRKSAADKNQELEISNKNVISEMEKKSEADFKKYSEELIRGTTEKFDEFQQALDKMQKENNENFTRLEETINAKDLTKIQKDTKNLFSKLFRMERQQEKCFKNLEEKIKEVAGKRDNKLIEDFKGLKRDSERRLWDLEVQLREDVGKGLEGNYQKIISEMERKSQEDFTKFTAKLKNTSNINEFKSLLASMEKTNQETFTKLEDAINAKTFTDNTEEIYDRLLVRLKDKQEKNFKDVKEKI